MENNVISISNSKTFQTLNAFEERFYENIKKAVEMKASDIHFEPHLEKYIVSVHLDQIRYDIDEITGTREQFNRFAEVVKEKCNFDMNIIGVEQDKSFSIPKLKYNFRANLLPVNFGEKICLRLLESNKQFSLDSYNLRNDAKEDLKLCLSKKQGLIVVSGPTGSGKTTLLYNSLSYLSPIKNNICTIEEPIEYVIDRINQSSTNKKRNVTFSSLLRGLMRQHPNVILIGEVRDADTAQAAIQAANTGHLVLTTVHANSAKEVFTRMLDFGVNKRVLKSNLLFSSAQRLIPKNCENCLVYEQDNIYVRKLNKILSSNFKIKKSNGCEKCRNGIKGVELVFEWGTRDFSIEKNLFCFEMKSNLKAQIKSLLEEGKINAENGYSTFN